MTDVLIRMITLGIWKTNCYLVASNDEAFIIDPAEAPETIENFFFTDCKEMHLKGILATHGHFDHVGAVQYFKDKYKIPFTCHSSDRKILRQANLFRKVAGDNQFFPIPAIDTTLEETKSLPLGELTIDVAHIPGHSEGSVLFAFDNKLFSGDILLENQIGRTDLPGGDKEKLIKSVNYILENFQNHIVFPGHGNQFKLTPDKISFFKNILWG